MKALLTLAALSLVALAQCSGPAGANQTVLAFNRTLHLAWSSYCNQSSLERWDCQWCVGPFAHSRLQLVKYFQQHKAGTQGYVGLSKPDQLIVVSYRGSVNFVNVIQDTEFILTKPPFGPADIRADHGFLAAYLSVRNDTRAGLVDARAQCPNCTVLFTGHSLGAAMVTMAAADLSEPSEAVALHTFGSPRVGNKQLVAWVTGRVLADSNSNSIRMRRQTDLVPALPPRSIGYEHLATEVWDKHTNDGRPDSYVTCDGSGEDPNCGDSDEHPPFPLDLLRLSAAEHTRYMSFQGGNCIGGSRD